ncbi:MAG: flagellar export chaperone FliS [Terracidiphilus sp.]
MLTYREHVLESASAVDLVVALYDGMIRFLYAAAEAADHGDEEGRRRSVKRALDIIIHLQARLRMDIGGRPAQALSEFYASIFAEILQASHGASRAKFEHAIECIRTVREAWKQVAIESGQVQAGFKAGADAHANSGSRVASHEVGRPSSSARIEWTV